MPPPVSLAPAIALSLVASLTQFDVAAVALALPAMGHDLGFTIIGGAWVVDAYSLAFAGLLLATGALADRYGRRRALMIGAVGFAAASALCGLAWNGPSLWAGRAAQGAAAAFLITGGLACLSETYRDPEQRARAFAWLGMMSGAALALGPTLGGWLTVGFGWRAIFFLNLPLCAAITLLVPRLVAETRDPAGRPLDWAGIALLTLGLCLTAWALLSTDSSTAPRLLGVAAGGAALWLFARSQGSRSRPMLDPKLFADRGVVGVGCLLFTMSIGYWSSLVFAPAYLLSAHHLPADKAGFAMLAATAPMLLFPPLGARLSLRIGFRRAFGGGMGLVAAGMAGAAGVAQGDGPLWLSLTAMAISGIGAALINPLLSGALVAMAPREQAGMAAALATTLRQTGFALGVALLGALTASGSAPFALSFAASGLAALLGVAAARLLPGVVDPRRG